MFSGEPTVGEVLDATLRYHKLDLETYQDRLDLLRHSSWIPSRVNLTFFAGRSGFGATHDDYQFADDRYLGGLDRSEWRAMAFASWRLPDAIYEHKAVAMQRVRELKMNDQVRGRLILHVHRNYGELQRLWARQRAGSERDLYVRAIEQARIDQLEAVVDLMSGGYLTRFRERVQRAPSKER